MTELSAVQMEPTEAGGLDFTVDGVRRLRLTLDGALFVGDDEGNLIASVAPHLVRSLLSAPHPRAVAKAAPVVLGRCPACGWAGLFIGVGGHLTCSQVDCPNPSAAAQILDDGETEHLVTFTEQGWTIRHPLRERIDDQMLTCDLNDACRGIAGPPPQLGTYRVVNESGWTWTPLRGRIFAHAMPQHHLISVLRDEIRVAHVARKRLIQNVADGKYDATTEESDEWATSPEGQATFREFPQRHP